MVTVKCSRCGGSGHYSYNQRDGRMCYGCNGTGTMQITEAAAKARARRAAKRATPTIPIAAVAIQLPEKPSTSFFRVEPGEELF